MVFCSKCGSENPNGSAYCYKCGTKLLTEIPDRKEISQPIITGKYPMPKADERAEKPRYQDIYPEERAMMNEAVRPPDDGNYGIIPEGYELRPIKPKNNNIALIVVVIIIGCIIVLAATMIFLMPTGTTTGSESIPMVVNGSYANYKMVVTNDSKSLIGSCTITYSNVTSTSMTMTTSITLNGQTHSESQNVNLVNHVWQVEDTYDSSNTDSTTTFTNLGEETIQTSLGSRDCYHTRTVTSTYTEDDWSISTCILKSVLTDTNGMTITLTIADTNISGL
ncbi:MAG: zinc ribbon domain-containing protein [Methanomassiliicoccus sp.]|nr:zinc ribbon domain-containing protein [Methanomassiliicoccus sp.]